MGECHDGVGLCEEPTFPSLGYAVQDPMPPPQAAFNPLVL